MPPIDGSAIILALLGVAGALIVFIYIDDRMASKKTFTEHDTRLKRLEREVSEIMLIRRDIEYIRQTLEEIRNRGNN